MTMRHVIVKRKSDDVSCPVCGKAMRKQDYPLAAMPVSPSGIVSKFLGKASCRNDECEQFNELTSWECKIDD